MTDASPGAAAAITCEDLWMVFGEHAKRDFDAFRGSNPEARRDDIADAMLAAGHVPAVRDVSFEVGEGELFIVMGLSGSGKSTVVRCLSRLLEPTWGTVLIEGESILDASGQQLIELRRRKMGMVFQHFGLFPHMTVADNVAFPLKVQGVDVDERKSRAEEMIQLVGLDGRQASYPRQLSGGQRQRVGIARSLAVNPDIWFLDEPFSALDPLIRRQLQDEFLHLQATLRKSIVFITHDIGEALKLADRIAIMRDGKVVQIGSPADIVLKPVDDYVAEFASDIPRGRLMTVESMMQPLNGSPPTDTEGAPMLAPSMSLEVALTACASTATFKNMPVSDGDGNIVGIVTPEQLARALGAVATEDSA